MSYCNDIENYFSPLFTIACVNTPGTFLGSLTGGTAPAAAGPAGRPLCDCGRVLHGSRTVVCGCCARGELWVCPGRPDECLQLHVQVISLALGIPLLPHRQEVSLGNFSFYLGGKVFSFLRLILKTNR